MKSSPRSTTQRQQSGRKNIAAGAGQPDTSLFNRAVLERQVAVHITNVGKNLTQTLERSLTMKYEGRCSVEGFIKAGSISMRSYSAGKTNGDNICFTTVFECQICHPVEDMVIKCIAKNVTKAGIRAESVLSPSPIVVFVTRDHNYNSEYFSSINEGDTINVKVIGQRFELHDTHISIVAQLIEPNTRNTGERDTDKLQRIKINETLV